MYPIAAQDAHCSTTHCITLYNIESRINVVAWRYAKPWYVTFRNTMVHDTTRHVFASHARCPPRMAAVTWCGGFLDFCVLRHLAAFNVVPAGASANRHADNRTTINCSRTMGASSQAVASRQILPRTFQGNKKSTSSHQSGPAGFKYGPSPLRRGHPWRRDPTTGTTGENRR